MNEKSIDTARGKIQKICDVLKNETIEPAKQEAKEIIENAQIQAKEIIEKANNKAKEIIEKSKEEKEKQQKVFESALSLAKKQAIDSLKVEIEQKLFDKSLSELIVKASADIKVLSNMITSIVKVIEENGIDTDIMAFIPKTASKKEINELIGKTILENLKGKSVEIGDFGGGVKISLKDNNITIDMSDDALFHIIAKYVRSDFRDIMFEGSNE